MIFIRTVLFCFLLTAVIFPQSDIPKIFHGLSRNADGKLQYVLKDGTILTETDRSSGYGLPGVLGSPIGSQDGCDLDFGLMVPTGSIVYGIIVYNDSKHPHPIYRIFEPIRNGKASLNVKEKLKGVYDIAGWEKTGKVTLGYRVMNEGGTILVDGKVTLSGKGPFVVDTTISNGPTVNIITDNSAVIRYSTNFPCEGKVTLDDKVFTSPVGTLHEIRLTGLESETEYQYTVHAGSNSESYPFVTAPKPGTRKPFTFAYASDSRNALGGGERNIMGTNAYIMKKVCALNALMDVAFMQFTGDMVTGYTTGESDMRLQFHNWKRAVEPFTQSTPIYTTMGNHEALITILADVNYNQFIPKFPFATAGPEVVYASEFTNPVNGPVSEDGSVYDPDPNAMDFPPYKETVYHYTYDNIAMVVLNSDYAYASSPKLNGDSPGGNLHAYLMDNQIAWLRQVLAEYEKDGNIDHVFITQHSPAFPNGGHSGDAMWYGGNNDYRPVIAGRPVERGAIEQRDQYLDAILNGSSKVRAMFTGDEHNYNRMLLTKDVNIYPEGWDKPKFTVPRPVYQINNGAAGAPYYAQEVLPWSDAVPIFSTQHAVVYITVYGEKVTAEVRNPDTLELIDEFTVYEKSEH